MSYCQLCGKQIPDGQKICAECQRPWREEQTESRYGWSGAQQGEVPPGGPVKKAPKAKAKAPAGSPVPVILMTVVLVLAAAGFVLSLLLGSSASGRTHPSGSLEQWQGSGELTGETTGELGAVTIPAPYAGSLQQMPEEQPLSGEEESEYVLPNSDSTYISEEVIAALTPEELRLARNEIYARHGRIFADEALDAYFNSKSWYQPLYDGATFDAWGDSILNQYEIANRDLIREYENLYSAGDN